MFVPILIMQLEAGQLFRDIAVAISVSVLLSLVVAVTVIPALASRLLRRDDQNAIGIWGLDHLARGFRGLVMAYVRVTVRFRTIGVIMVAVIAGVRPLPVGRSYRALNTCQRGTAIWSLA
ncbi:efflux RND transporter permease subunit [Yoonia sp. GPGPB17]|uniref:efflux RND transporter permease subunit n=1 Tax=Yoonia sp. GPGPB17 TaxID=3026147 RepID=UPI0030BAF9F6